MILPVPPCDLDLGHNGKSQSYTFCSALIQPRADFTTLVVAGWRLEKKSYHRFATAREYIDRGQSGRQTSSPVKARKLTLIKKQASWPGSGSIDVHATSPLEPQSLSFPLFLALSRRCPGQVYNRDKKSSALGNPESPLRIL